jgi:hypothetical protein
MLAVNQVATRTLQGVANVIFGKRMRRCVLDDCLAKLNDAGKFPYSRFAWFLTEGSQTRAKTANSYNNNPRDILSKLHCWVVNNHPLLILKS